jgi:hypothetical protein
MSIDESVARVKNPLAMVAVFAAISEVAMAFVITKLPDKLQEIFIWFVMGFPTILVFVFFFVLYRRPAVFFSPGDYKKEELYVTSIGLSKIDESLDQRIKRLEDTLTTLQDFLEEAKLGSGPEADYTKFRRTLQWQKELENNPLYAFITADLRVEHDRAQRIVAAAADAWELPKLLEAELHDRQRSARLFALLTSFPSAAADFQKLKTLILERGGSK